MVYPSKMWFYNTALPMPMRSRLDFSTKLTKNPYRNALNREMKDMKDTNTDPIAIRLNMGLTWDEKIRPESSEYYTRLYDGNYHRIGHSMELPSTITKMEIIEMRERIAELEAILKGKSYTKVIEDSVINNDVANLIERITRRHESEAKRYKEMYHVEHNKKIEARNTIKELKAEIEILKATGVFPIHTDPAKHASDMKRRFANIGFLDPYTV